MTINNRSADDVKGDVTNIQTKENDFRDGMNDIIDQVDENQVLLANVSSSDLTKLADIDASAADVNILDGANDAGVTATEFQTLNGVTSAIQTQLDAKEATISSSNKVSGTNITDNSITATQIAANAVTASELANDAVDTAAIADDAVTNAKMADDAINTVQIVDDAVTNDKMADNAIDTAQLATDAVTGAKIADSSINSEHYVDGSIDTVHLSDGAVTNAKIGSSVNVASADTVDVHLDSTNANRPILWNQGTATPNGTARTVGANNSELSYNPSTNQLIITPTGASIVLGGWTLVENSSGGLDFNRGTDTVFRMDTDGHFHADDDVSAYSSTI